MQCSSGFFRVQEFFIIFDFLGGGGGFKRVQKGSKGLSKGFKRVQKGSMFGVWGLGGFCWGIRVWGMRVYCRV